VATPVVAGAAALLFQRPTTLTPNMVKMLLMYTAQPLAVSICLSRAGEVNIEGAVRLVKLMRKNLRAACRLAHRFCLFPALKAANDHRRSTFSWAQGVILAQLRHGPI
jgi:hypothetical protein